MGTPTDPGLPGCQPGSYCIPQPTLVRWVVSQFPIVYPNRPWLVGWSASFQLYTPADHGLLGGQQVVLMYIPTKYVHSYYICIRIYREVRGCVSTQWLNILKNK